MFRATLLAALLCAIAVSLAAYPSGSSQVRAQGTGKTAKDSPQKDLDALKKVFGVNEVSVLLLHQPQPIQGRIGDVIDVFGRRFLMITDNEGRNYLLNPELITAIRQK